MHQNNDATGWSFDDVREAEARASKWLLSGGGGFEGTPAAVRFHFAGVVELLAAYEEYLIEQFHLRGNRWV